VYIIGGSLKKRRIFSPKDNVIRPISSKLQAAIFDFSFMQENIRDTYVLDLFSGTGVLGLEALSRGALECVFVDVDTTLVKKNISLCKCQKQSIIIQKDWKKSLDILKNKTKRFDIIFVDPPYELQNYSEVLEAVAEKELLETSGYICIKHSTKCLMKDRIKNVHIFCQRQYGTNTLTFYERENTYEIIRKT